MNTTTLPILLLDCNLSPASGKTFVNAIQRMAPIHAHFEVVRVSEGNLGTDGHPVDWVHRAKQGNYCGIVISGSAANPLQPDPWVQQLNHDIREVSAQGIPTFGICFGHQLLAHAWGGEVGENVLGYKMRGIRSIQVHDISSTQWPLLPENTGGLQVLASHRDQVLHEPPGWHVVATSDFCKIQAMRSPNLPILSVQWHPEADEQFLRDNPHPEWNHLTQEQLLPLSGNQILQDFLASLGTQAPPPHVPQQSQPHEETTQCPKFTILSNN